MNIDSVSQFILKQASADDLSALVTAVKMRRQQLTKKVVRAVKIGDRVSFKTKNRGIMSGTVTKVGYKNIYVLSDSRAYEWKVPASLVVNA